MAKNSKVNKNDIPSKKEKMIHKKCPVTTQMRSNTNAIYQHLEKFDREKKKKKVKVYGKIRTRSIPSHT